jgi:hypothetical protein
MRVGRTPMVSYGDGYRDLIFAVLRRSLRDLGESDNYNRKAALKWFEAPPSDDAFSFYWCCDALKLDPGRVLEVVKNLGKGHNFLERL